MTHPYSYPTRSSTALSRHLKRRHTSIQGAKSPLTLDSIIEISRQERLTPAKIYQEILKFFVSGNIPFNQVGNSHFQKLISWIIVQGSPMKSVSRKVLRSTLSEASSIASMDLLYSLRSNVSKVSLALDCWTSRTGHTFIGMFFLCNV
jgi:hypothetical protein